MKKYESIVSQIPKEAWQFVHGICDETEDENGDLGITFYWDTDEHPELKPLNLLSHEDWEEFVNTSIENTLKNEEQRIAQPSNCNDGPSGELDQKPDTPLPS